MAPCWLLLDSGHRSSAIPAAARSVGSISVSFDCNRPEPAKLAIVLVMAKYFQTDEPPRGYYLRDLWVPFALVAPLVLSDAGPA